MTRIEPRRRAERRRRRPNAGSEPVSTAEGGGQGASGEETALVARIGRGDGQAFRFAVERHLGPVAGFAGRILADSAEAEDVAQETFLRLWREADRWQPRARLSAWLFRVAYNLCIDRIRKRRGMIGFDTIADPPSPARNAEERLAEAEIAARVEQAIGALPARQRAAIALVHQQGLGNIEAASVLGISVEALESLLARGRRQLKDILSPLSAGEGGGR